MLMVKPHISPSTAGVNAMNEAAGKLGKEIIRQHRKVEYCSIQFYKVLYCFENADFMSYTMFESFLKVKR